jgi:cell division protein FtsI (penicillin-binding protein 3)
VATQPANAWRTTVKRRLAVAAGAFLLWSVAIEARLVYLQVLRHAELSSRAERQQSRTIEAPAKRGELLDRGGRVLAYSVDADTIYAVPTDIEDPDTTSSALCGALADCSAKDRHALAERIRRGRAFVYVGRQVSPEQAGRVAALDLTGVGFMKESRRFYPNKELAAHLLGYVGIDNGGLHGIEAAYDSLIKGRPGTVLIQTDARRHAFSRIERPPTAGATLELTIDQYLQHIAERELKAGVDASRAAGGSAVVMDPSTGEILALANYPTFNPNAYRGSDVDAQRNRAIQDLYEPGSTFKIVTASAALEERVVRPRDQIDVSTGFIRFGSRVISDTPRHRVPLSFEDVIVQSSNVGAIKVGLRLGPQRLGAYVNRFGFGRPSSPDFRGENPGIVWNPSQLTESALASVSIGYQVGVTPLQMAAAVSSVANGGKLIEPRLVRAVIRDGKRAPVPHKVLRRTISPETAAQLTSMMEAVVERGTAKRAQIRGYTIAGKTGTAAKVVNGRYSRSDYNVSFVGFVPSRAPLFTIIIVIDSPRTVSAYGGVIAAPVFQRIADRALRHHGVPPSIHAAPPLLVTRQREADGPAPLDSRSLARGRPATGPARLPLVTLASASDDSALLVPDLQGLSARDALRLLARLGLSGSLHGTGIVVAQRPEPGTPVERGTSAALWLARGVRQVVSPFASETPPSTSLGAGPSTLLGTGP